MQPSRFGAGARGITLTAVMIMQTGIYQKTVLRSRWNRDQTAVILNPPCVSRGMSAADFFFLVRYVAGVRHVVCRGKGPIVHGVSVLQKSADNSIFPDMLPGPWYFEILTRSHNGPFMWPGG